MSFITQFFIKPKKPALIQVPAGSFTIDRTGHVITSTLPHSFQTAHLLAIGQQVLAAFRSAEQAEMRLGELVIHYPKLKLVACEQRGGAFVLLTPQKGYARNQ
jgi:hypothetical protein